jgi:polysaccharide biosynthesis/export protein
MAKLNLKLFCVIGAGLLLAAIGGVDVAIAADPPQKAADAAQKDADAPLKSEYVIGPGDTLQVFVWRNPELSVSVPVRPDGKVSTPLVDDMVAVGKTSTQLARDIENVLTEFIRTPQVTVLISNAMSTYSQVQVIGQVKTPQALPYRDGMRLLDVILAVGGLNEFAAANRTKLIRRVGDKEVETRVKLGNLMNSGDMSQNVELLPGDVVIVPQSMF